MVHWVFSSFGKHPVASPKSVSAPGREPPPVTGLDSTHIMSQEGQRDGAIPSPNRDSKRDSDFNSQRASAGSSTLNTRPSRSQTVESSHTLGSNLRALAERTTNAAESFYSRDTLNHSRRSQSLDLGAGEEPRPSWPLPESILTASAAPSIASTSHAPRSIQSSLGHTRSFSNSGRRRSPVRARSSHEMARSMADRERRSHEHLRSASRAGLVPMANLAELAGSAPPERTARSPVLRAKSAEQLGNVTVITGGPAVHQMDGPSSGVRMNRDLTDALPEEGAASSSKSQTLVRNQGDSSGSNIDRDIFNVLTEEGNLASLSRSGTMIGERKSSRKAPTITSQSSNLRDVDPEKRRGLSRSSSSRTWRIRRSQQAFLSPRDIASPPPGSRSRDSGATALPRFLYNQSNLEEQLEAARILQDVTPPVSLNSHRNRVASRLATELYTLSYLIFFSIWGTLARLGLQALTFYPGAPVVISVLWANFAGSFILGFLAEDRRLFREEWGSHSPDTPSFEQRPPDVTSPTDKFHFPHRRGHRDEDAPSQVVSHSKVKKTIPLYIGLTTGFCGSFTSFSSFMRDAFLALSNDLPNPTSSSATSPHRHAAYSLTAVLAVILTTLTLSLAALRFGAHLAIASDAYTPTLRFTLTRRIIDPLSILLGLGTWIAAIILSVFPPAAHTPWRSQALFACVFAPLGCITRFYISLWLNNTHASTHFPLGTFAVNVFGTAVEAMAFDLQRVRVPSSASALVGGGVLGCQVLQGVMDGYCGALTTVSTWVAEVNGLRRGRAYAYALGSVAAGVAVVVGVMGGVRWTVGWSEVICVV